MAEEVDSVTERSSDKVGWLLERRGSRRLGPQRPRGVMAGATNAPPAGVDTSFPSSRLRTRIMRRRPIADYAASRQPTQPNFRAAPRWVRAYLLDCRFGNLNS